MRNLLKFFIKYPTWPNVIKILVLIFGLMAVFNLKSSFFPEKELRVINIQITYPGASPEEIEKGVINKIEDNLKGLQGIERFTSKSRENVATITIESLKGYETDVVLQDVKNAVNRINSFPSGMEPPVVFKSPSLEFAISFGITGPDELKSLKEISRKVESDLRSLDGISQIELSGFPNEEIVIYLNEEQLRRYGISPRQIVSAVQDNNLDITAGTIKSEKEEILIRLEAKDYYAEGLGDITIYSNRTGESLLLSDLAEIKNTWEESPKRTYINDKLAVMVTVNKILGEDIVNIAEQVNKYIDEFNKTHEDYEAIVLDDYTITLQERLDMLLSNGAQGAILVLLSLALFLNLRLSFWVALGLPFSFLGMFMLMSMVGLTINQISLFGCILVVGILVDDGIVISEQIYQNYEKGMKPFKASLEGTLNVLPSVVFAILTTITAFIPFFFFEGKQGENMIDMAFVVIITVLFSLIESALILPSHLAHSKAIREKKTSKIREKINQLLLYPRDKWFAVILKYTMSHRFIVIATAIALTAITIGAFRGGVIGLTFFPFLDNDYIEISLQLPAGSREAETKKILSKIEDAAWQVNEELKNERPDGKEVILNVVQNIAQGPTGLFGSVSQGDGNIGTVRVVLLSGEQRNMDSYLIGNRIKEKVGPVFEAERLTYGEGSMFGKPVSIPLISSNLDDLYAAKRALKDSMNTIAELTNATDNDPMGQREIKLKLNDKAQLLGITNADLALQARQAFFGAEIQRLQRGEDEIKVWVRYDDENRSTISDLETMRIRLQDGSQYPLIELADYEITRSSQVINHLDGSREITVEADMVDQNAEVPPVLSKVRDEMLPKILEMYPSVTTAESGQQREIMKTARSARTTMTIAFIVMFFLIALSFRSYTQALVVFSLIPLGLIGAFWGHFIQGLPVNMMSAYGIIALIGIIVNNSIVYVNTMNQFLNKGMGFKTAIFECAMNRFRPILLTTITTVLGLLPLLASKSRQATFLVPMAISVAYGLLIGSFFIMLYLPVFLLYLNDIKRLWKWLLTGEKPTREAVEPAIIEKEEYKKYFGNEGN